MIIEELSKRHVLFMDEEYFTGIYLSIHLINADNYVYIVDSGLGTRSTDPINKYIKDNNINKPIILINSHFHWDHIMGNPYIDAKWIVSHDSTVDKIKGTWDIIYKDIYLPNKERIGEASLKLPNLTFSNKLDFIDDGIHLVYAPGHTTTCIYIYDSVEKVLNIADNIGDTMDDIIPSLEISYDEYRETINQVKLVDAEIVISGHNEITTTEVFDLILTTLDTLKK